MKKLLTLTFMFCSAVVWAQNTVQDALVADFERAKSMTLAYIDAMPQDQFSFKPTEETRSFAEQLLHAAQGTIGLTSNGTGMAKIYPDQNLEKVEIFKTKSEVRRLVSESLDFAISGIKQMDPATFDEVVARGPFKVTRLEWVRKANEHISHHRGQCAIYLRLVGITPPAYQLFE